MSGNERVEAHESETPESNKQAFLQALNVPRNAKVGLAFGVVFTLGVYYLFVVVPGTFRSPLWYLGLGFVLALSVGAVAAFALTVVSAYRLSRAE